MRPLIQGQDGSGRFHRLSGHGDERMSVGIEPEIPTLRPERLRAVDEGRVVVGVGVQCDPCCHGQGFVGRRFRLHRDPGVVTVQCEGRARHPFLELCHESGDFAARAADGIHHVILMRRHALIEIPMVERCGEGFVFPDGAAFDGCPRIKRRLPTGNDRAMPDARVC